MSSPHPPWVCWESLSPHPWFTLAGSASCPSILRNEKWVRQLLRWVHRTRSRTKSTKSSTEAKLQTKRLLCTFLFVCPAHQEPWQFRELDQWRQRFHMKQITQLCLVFGELLLDAKETCRSEDGDYWYGTGCGATLWFICYLSFCNISKWKRLCWNVKSQKRTY